MNEWLAPVVWLGVAIVCAVLEGASVQLTAIWFAVGAVGAAITSLLGGDLFTQFIVFVVLSTVLLILTRPFLKKLNKQPKHNTNADQVIGKIGVVMLEIDNLKNQGRVKVMGLDWAAHSQTGEVIAAGANVMVHAIEGVKLVVSPENPA